MKKILNKPVALFAGAMLLAGGAAFAHGDDYGNTGSTSNQSGMTSDHTGSTSNKSGMTSKKTLPETTNSGDTSMNTGSTNSDMGGVKPQGTNASSATDQAAMTGKHAKKDMHYKGAMKAIPHTTVSFDAGSATLSETARADLRDMIKDAKAKGEIDQVTVAAWSDKALPAQNTELTEADRDLAMKRADAISSVLKTELEVGDVDTYNMAERANWLARTFDTRDAELKSIFSRKGADTPVTNAEFHVIKNEGGPSQAVVVVEKKMR